MLLDLKAPHTIYRGANGERLPGVTTICDMVDKPQLRAWYAEVEREGVLDALRALELVGDLKLPLRPNGKVMPFAEIKRDKAADLGTITHARVQAWLNADTLDPFGIPPELYAQSQHGLDRFVEWWEQGGFRLLKSEQQLINESGDVRYGGTADILAMDASLQNVLVDLKTSKRSKYWPYDETYAQVAAYADAASVDPAVALDIARILVVRIGKEPGDEIQVVELTTAQRTAGWRLFRGAYEVYQAKKELER